MPLFQNSVLNKYLKAQDSQAAKTAYQQYAAYFHNPEIQQNIRDVKEEQFQEGFLRELFVNILGYTLNPQPEFNLTTEFKNEKGAQKADGAILQAGKALAVIELKGTDTTDLDKINTQAFNYKNNQSNCIYVITSNFEKLRFFIHHAVEYIEFNLFTLTAEEFQILWLCLRLESLFNGIPLKAKEESLLVEEKITRQLYQDYSAFRKALWQNMVENSLETDKLLLFKKTQKLLDRFLFIFFAEDKGLLPPNSISKIVEQWQQLKELDEYRPLYERFKKYFGYLNTGWKGKEYEIFAYNGGLFRPDEVLDEISINDEALHPHVMKLTGYDFESEVDVNILGHIFEHSLTEMENITAELEGREVEKSKTRRKKDGVFYTPKYITKYIVDNTLGKLCADKKQELEISENVYESARKRSRKRLQNLQAYRDWLLNLTICDPACGSGAFLNQALEFLINEHRTLDELTAKYHRASLILSDIEDHILEKNIYGVDINEESVEIAKLSLWLHTATKGRKLTSLSHNIKCGNSLINDREVAGEKAFNWRQEFPEVFAQGGFDVVIGNPPYLRVQGLRENFEKETAYYEKSYAGATGRFDIYVLFIERAYGLIASTGKVGFILPHKFMVSDFGEGIRKFLADNKAVESVVHFGSEMVFEDASTYTCILTLSQANAKVAFREMQPLQLFSPFGFDEMDAKLMSGNKWSLQDGDVSKVMIKLSEQKLAVKDVFEGIFQGIVSGDNNAFYLSDCVVKGGNVEGYNQAVEKRVEIETGVCKIVANGKDVGRYKYNDTRVFIIYPYKLADGKTILIEENELKNKYPLCYSYLQQIEERLRNRGSKSMKYPSWYSLWNFRNIVLQEAPKILTPDVCFKSSMYFDSKGELYHNDTSYALIQKEGTPNSYKFYLGLLNSTLCWFYLKKTSSELRGGYFRFKTKYLEPFPLPIVDNPSQQPLIEQVDDIMKRTAELQKIQKQFTDLLQSKFDIDKLSKKLQVWYELDFKEFLKELKKAKVTLGLAEEAEWMTYFNEQKQKAWQLKTEMNRIDKEIDQMVYELYGLTEEEIKVVEEA